MRRIYYLCAQICRKHEKAEDYGAEQDYCRGVQGGWEVAACGGVGPRKEFI